MALEKYHYKFIQLIVLLICIALHFNLYAANKLLSYPGACVSGPKVTIGAVGDLLLHKPLQLKGAQNGFESLWQIALPYFKKVDITYANLEGPISVGTYTGYPLFNYPPAVADALKKSDIDIVSIANNHILDRSTLGIDSTIQALDEAGIAYVGARSRNSQGHLVSVIKKKGFKIAWIACTDHTNGHPDKFDQVLFCYNKTDQQWIFSKIRELKTKVDAIIVSPHWGEEYQSRPNPAQIGLAKKLLEEGAIAVIGSHPHVLQPVEKYTTSDGRATLISYSLGNFVSYQGRESNRSSIILLLGLTKTANQTVINSVQFVPLYMENRNGIENIRLTIPSKVSTLVGNAISPDNVFGSDFRGPCQ